MENIFEALAQITKPEPALLSHLEQAARNAHRNTSFDPEKRGANMISGYSEELSEDIADLKQCEHVTEEQIADYVSRYERFFSSYLHAKSNTFSVMITGAGNFPTRRHEKANRSEQRHYEIFREWRQRAKKAIVRKIQPVKTYLSELDRYKAELTEVKARHEKTLKGNKVISKAKKTGEDITEYLIKEFNVSSGMMDLTKKFGFNTVNSNATIKRIEQRIKEMELKEKRREEKPVTNYTFDGGEMIINYEVDRIQIIFSTRPTSQELTAWKSKGLNSFNWSPSNNAWQRKITANALWSVKHIFPNLKPVI